MMSSSSATDRTVIDSAFSSDEVGEKSKLAPMRRMSDAVRRMQLTGKLTLPAIPTSHAREPQGTQVPISTISDLPQAFVAQHERTFRKNSRDRRPPKSFLSIIREIYDIMDASGAHPQRLHIVLQELLNRLSDYHYHMLPEETEDFGLEPEVSPSDRDHFLKLGGAECLLRVLDVMRRRTPNANLVADERISLYRQRNDIRSMWDEPDWTIQPPSSARSNSIKFQSCLNSVMALLRELCFSSPELGAELCSKDGLIIYLFQLLENAAHFENAAALVEEILAMRNDCFDLTRIPRIHEILQSCSSRQLAFFCRILALVIFEPEDRRFLESTHNISSLELLQLRSQRMKRQDTAVDRNHALLLQTPSILQRMLRIIQVQNYYFAVDPVYNQASEDVLASAEFAMLHHQSADRSDWETIDHLLQHPAVAPTGDLTRLYRSYRRNEDRGNDGHGQNNFPFASTLLRDMMLATEHATDEGASRINAEATVLTKAIVLQPFRVEILFVLCTLLNSKRKVEYQDRLAEMGLIPILTIMFDKLEWDENQSERPRTPLHGPGCECTLESSFKIQFLRLVHNFCDREAEDHSNRRMLLSDRERDLLDAPAAVPIDFDYTDKGLLCKLIEEVTKQKWSSTYRFWLSSCLEAYLRHAKPEEQLFVARTPLLQALVNEVLEDESYRTKGRFQSVFDLLGDMTKGNVDTTLLFHRTLDDDQFVRFMHVVVNNLVDSNVFLRSMLLFSAEEEVEDTDLDRMNEFITHNTSRLVRDLMSIVTLEEVGHENLCCLNTALVILVLAYRKGHLVKLLDEVKEHEEKAGRSGYVRDNFRRLLWFWMQYYTPRGRDRLGLEVSTNIAFREWKEVVSLLCKDDGSETALTSVPPSLPETKYSRLYSNVAVQRSH